VDNPLRDVDLYALTSEEHSLGRSNLDVVQAMLDAGVKLVQYREKKKTPVQKLQECEIIRALTSRYGALFVVNDDVALAQVVDADGVHVGQDDLPVPAIRKLLGSGKIIGLSTQTRQEAVDALSLGVDYIGVGPIYATRTKEDACAPVGLDLLTWVLQNVALPVVAIGGIKESNIAEVVRHGARCMAMVSEIVSKPDIGHQVRMLRRIMHTALQEAQQ